MMRHESGGEGGHVMSTAGRLIRPHELALVLLGAGAGVLWALISLTLGFSLSLVEGSVAVRGAGIIFNLPLYLAGWLAYALHLTIIDPSGLVMAAGVALTLVPVAVWIGAERWQARQ
jgi:hypothetical protein